MGWQAIVTANPKHRVAGSCGPFVLLENHITAPTSAIIFDARTDGIAWQKAGDFHNATIAHDETGEIIIYRTSGTPAENAPVPTGLFLVVEPVEPPAENEVLDLCRRIAAKLGA